MITIADILHPKNIRFDLEHANQEELVYNVAMLLKTDEHVKDWQAFYDGLKAKDSCIYEEQGVRLCIPHVRANSVSMMVMAVGRSTLRPSAGDEYSRPVTQYTFVIGVPIALSSDYLRIMGALARIFKKKATEARLRTALTPAEFLAVLVNREMAI
jgi:mannitol/fructose-specific phosphotransferase system IIA component (Ntr-type)